MTDATGAEPDAMAVSIDDAVGRILELCTRDIETVILDGPSGAGKSTLANALVLAWPGALSLVRMDNVYPGWGGLAAGSRHVHDALLEPRRRSAPSRWQRHDWASGKAAEWHSVPANHSLLLEGCGALSRCNASLATVRIWLDADDEERKRRALARDGGGFDAHWDEWQEQFERFVGAEDPVSRADVRLRLP